MGDEVVPGRHLALEVAGVDVAQCPELQVPLVGVVAVELEVEVDLGRLHHRDVFEAVAEPKRPMMMEVVTEELIGRRRLRRDRLEGRMRLQHTHDREPPAVGDAEHADAAVIVGNVFEQPVDRVVGVGPFINRLGIATIPRRPVHDELSLRLVAAADVLEDEDVPFLGVP